MTGSGLATASNWTVPSPWPLAPALMLIHPLSEEAVQAHSRAVVTVTVPAPPRAGTAASGAVTDTPHLDTVAGEVMVVVADEPHPQIARPARSIATGRAAPRSGDAARIGR